MADAHADSDPGTTDSGLTAGQVRSLRYEHGSGRERVLDAYTHILLTEGVAAATLDEVAKQADISKGGLLHHFASKEALIEGLLERLIEANQADIEQTSAAPEGAVDAYLNGSAEATGAYSRTLMAVIRLAGSSDTRVDEVMQRSEQAWYQMLLRALGDPLKARLVQLVGDGYYLNALIGNRAQRRDDRAVREFLTQFVENS